MKEQASAEPARVANVLTWLRQHGFGSLMKAAMFVALGFMAGQAYRAEELKQQVDLDHKSDIKEIKNNVENSLRPLRAHIKADLEEAMLICREAGARSIRAADTAKEASEAASSVLDEQKRFLHEEHRK